MGVFSCYLSSTTKDDTTTSTESADEMDMSDTVEFCPFAQDDLPDLELTLPYPMTSTPTPNVRVLQSTANIAQENDLLYESQLTALTSGLNGNVPSATMNLTGVTASASTDGNPSILSNDTEAQNIVLPHTFLNIASLQPTLNVTSPQPTLNVESPQLNLNVASPQPTLSSVALEAASNIVSSQNELALNSNHTVTLSELARNEEDTVRIEPGRAHSPVSPRSPTPPVYDEVFKSTIRIHRSNVLNEMVSYFKTPGIIDTPLSFTFVNEIGSDVSGISREAYSLFWKDFFCSNADGERSRVPVINSQWGAQEWESVGGYFGKGFS